MVVCLWGKQKTAYEMLSSDWSSDVCSSELLAQTLKLNDRVDWETLKERTPFAGDQRFPESEPQRKTTPEPRYQEPNTGLWDVIFGRKGRKLAEAKERYESDLKQWQRAESCNAAVFSAQLS